MVRRRGGGTGRGQDQGEKRQATTPVGGLYKDSRRNIQGDEEYDDEEEWTQVIHSKQKTPPNISGSGSGPAQLNQPDYSLNDATSGTDGASYAGVASGSNTILNTGTIQKPQSHHQHHDQDQPPKPKKQLERKFVTPAPEGAMRDDIVLEIREHNGKPFKGSLTMTEARDGIFSKGMGLDKALIHGIRFGYSDFPVVKFKLKTQIDVDALHPIEFFEVHRSYAVGTKIINDKLSCHIRGIRTTNVVTREADADPSVRWVKVEWAEYSLSEEKMLAWLEIYGTKVGEFSEDLYPDSDSEADPVGCGTFSIKMKLNRDIPQILPMWGKRIRVYHRGIQKLCTNCYGPHPRRNCRSKKVPWIEYVLDFMEKNPDLPKEIYGRWWKVVNDKYGEITEGAEQQERTDIDESESNYVQHYTQATRSQPEPTRQEWCKEPIQTQEKSKNPQSTKSVMTSKEEEELSDYLDMGMSISEAREMYQKEIDVAEMRQQIRENKKRVDRGSVNPRSRAHIGPGSNSGRGRGGLAFN